MIYLHNRIPFWQQEGSHKTSTRTFCFLLSRSPASVPNSRPTTPQVGCSVQSTSAAAFRGPCAPHQSTPGEKAAGADGKNLHTDSKHNTWAVKADCSKFNKLLISHQCKSAAKHTHTHTLKHKSSRATGWNQLVSETKAFALGPLPQSSFHGNVISTFRVRLHLAYSEASSAGALLWRCTTPGLEWLC